jgi:hypothetical protein
VVATENNLLDQKPRVAFGKEVVDMQGSGFLHPCDKGLVLGHPGGEATANVPLHFLHQVAMAILEDCT